MPARSVTVRQVAALVSLLLVSGACRPPAGPPARVAARAPAAETPTAKQPTRVPPASASPSTQAIAQLDAAFASALRETRAPYLQARATILAHPAAREYLRERLARTGDEHERLLASVLLAWLDDPGSFAQAHAWLSDQGRRERPDVAGFVQAFELGKIIAREGGPSLALPLLETRLKTFEHEQPRSYVGPWGEVEQGYQEEALASALHGLGDPRGFAPLLAIASDRSEPDAQRQLATWALAGARDPRVEGVLAGMLRDHGERAFVRQLAADGLLERKPPQLRELLEQVLLDPETAQPVRSELATCLAVLADPAAVPALERVLERAREPAEIIALCDALGDLGGRESLRPLQAVASRVGRAARERCTTAIESIRARLAASEPAQRVVR